MDVAVTHCLTAAAMRNDGAARRDGVAAALMETHKRSSYPGVRVTPAVVETHGGLGKSLHRMWGKQATCAKSITRAAW